MSNFDYLEQDAESHREEDSARLACLFKQTNCIISVLFCSGAPMNDVINGQVFLLVSNNAVILFAVQISLIRLSERSLAENHLAVLGYPEPIGLTELGCIQSIQGQELSQSVQRKATIAAAVAMAVYQQQIATTRNQVAMKSTALEEVQPPNQSQYTDRIPLQKSFVNGQSQNNGGRVSKKLGKLQDPLCCAR